MVGSTTVTIGSWAASSGGTAHLRQLARERGHQIGAMTPMALDAGQPPDYGPAIEMLIHNSNLRQARAGPSPP